MRKDRKFPFFFIISIVFTLTIVFLSITLPRFLLEKNAAKDVMVISTVPENYYSASHMALARNTSKGLDAESKLKIIKGEWDSVRSECSIEEGFLTKSQAVKLAQNLLLLEYNKRKFDYDLRGNYKNWYKWDCKLYRFTDTTFNTYTAYLWEITFTKSDNSISHRISFTEDGTIIEIETTEINE